MSFCRINILTLIHMTLHFQAPVCFKSEPRVSQTRSEDLSPATSLVLHFIYQIKVDTGLDTESDHLSQINKVKQEAVMPIDPWMFP